MRTDAELLRHYAETRDEQAFTELVGRHLDFVYSAALRQVSGDVHLAQDATQKVFVDLARKAASVAQRESLAGWLYTSAHFAASSMVRTERRRRSREQEAQMSQQLTNDPTAVVDWSHLRSVLDGAMLELNETDREAVLLRFFREHSFLEIGATLRLSEEAARKRVDRALDKLHGLLSRRGVTSTTTALGLALSQHAVTAAPTGLLAAVSGAAVMTPTGSISLFALMSTTKFSGGAVAAAIALLGFSLAGNAYLFLHPTASRLDQTGDVQEATIPLSDEKKPISWLREQNPMALRDQLRAAGASETSIRATLEGILRRRYREQFSEDRATRWRLGWWKDAHRGTERVGNTDPRLLREMVTLPLEKLLGPDPADIAEAEARYAFLPAELRQRFGRLDRESLSGWSPTGRPEVDARLQAEYEEQRRQTETQRRGLIASLTPEQRVEYNLRLSEFATDLRRQLENVSMTEQDYRRIFPIAEAHAEALEKTAKAEDPAAVRNELQQRTMDSLVAALGYDQALDYIWSGAAAYPAYARVVREANLPKGTAGRVLQLAAETASQASAIHRDAALTVEKKRAALLDLQSTIQPTLDELIPSSVRQRLPTHVLSWMNSLSEGRYHLVHTTLPGQVRAFIAGGEVSIETPPMKASQTQQQLPQRQPRS